MSDIQKRNKMLMMYATLTDIIIMIGTLCEYTFDGARLIVVIAVSIAMVLANIAKFRVYIKNRESNFLQLVVIVAFSVMFIMMVLCIENFWIFFLPFPMLAAFTVYENKKIVLVVGIACNVINFIGVARHMNVVYKNKMPLLNGWVTLTEIIILIAYTVSIVMTSRMIKEDNDEKLKEVKHEQEKSKELSTQVIRIGNEIKEHAHNTDEIISELDIATDNTLSIFDKIISGNNENLECVKKQSNMTSSIRDMINNVQSEVDMADYMTSKSIDELESSITKVVDIKEQSETILMNNDELLKAIQYFLNSIKKIKSLIEGIADISEQTDMLALNASIECARAGDAGKGFVYVAHAISNLADETDKLTEDIFAVIKMLEHSAIKAKTVVYNVASAIDEENVILDTAIAEFKDMNVNLASLGNNMKAIFERVGNIVSYSKEIENYTQELEKTSNKVSVTTYETVSLNEKNKNKTKETKRLMNALIELSNGIKGGI